MEPFEKHTTFENKILAIVNYNRKLLELFEQPCILYIDLSIILCTEDDTINSTETSLLYV